MSLENSQAEMADNTEESTGKKYTKRCATGLGNGTAARHLTNGRNYRIRYDTSQTTVVNVIDKTVGRRGAPVVRLDGPHRGAEFNHININPRVSGRPDPHLNVGGGRGTLTAGKYAVKTLQWVNRGIIVAAVAADAYRTGSNIAKDWECGSSRNTVECAANIAGGWGGGWGGATGGAALGTAIFPGIGTIVGGIIGGVAGGIGGSVATTAATEYFFDKLDYDMDKYYCPKCKEEFEVRRYENESRDCPHCGHSSTKL